MEKMKRGKAKEKLREDIRNNPGVKQAVVRNVSLAYYDSVIPQNYLQPIYVFEGDGNFIGYVSAIDLFWVE